MLLVLNLPLVGLWVRILRIPAPLLYGGILVFATIGTYGISQLGRRPRAALRDGRIGFLMRRFDFPTAPVIIGMILGPLGRAGVPAGHDDQPGRLDDLHREAAVANL